MQNFGIFPRCTLDHFFHGGILYLYPHADMDCLGNKVFSQMFVFHLFIIKFFEVAHFYLKPLLEIYPSHILIIF